MSNTENTSSRSAKGNGVFSKVGNPIAKLSRLSKGKSTNVNTQTPKKIVIGNPTGFKHAGHMEKDGEAAWGIAGLPPKWIEMLEKSNLDKDRIFKNPDKAIVAMQVAENFSKKNVPRGELLSKEELEEKLLKTGGIQQINPETLFKKELLIGKGSGGTVYKALDRKKNEMVAVKVSPIAELSFIKYEVAYHALSEHPNIVTYFGTYQWLDEVWIAMELVDGGCLTDLLGEDGSLDVFWVEPYIAFVLQECLQGLYFMHSQYLLHRDIKSDNVLVSRDGSVKLADFGFAVGLSQERSRRITTGKCSIFEFYA